jgi:hypothetical protein
MPVELAVAPTRAQEILQKRKRLLSPRRGALPLCELLEPDNLARLYHTAAVNHYHNLLYWSHHRTNSGIEPPIIRAIKTIRKKN